MPVDTGSDSSLVPCRAFNRETAAPLKHSGSFSFFACFVSEKAGVLGVHYTLYSCHGFQPISFLTIITSQIASCNDLASQIVLVEPE